MSKAFTKESDDVPEAPVRRRGAAIPDPNYVTATGMATMMAELAEASDPDRIRELSDHLATAVVVEPTDRAIVGIGATVTVETEAGVRTQYRIVGALEASPKAGAISWESPIAKRLFNARVGDTVTLPRGDADVVAIEYS